MKNILFIGVGGTGSQTIKILYQKIRELGNQTDNEIGALIFDTTLETITAPDEAKLISLSDSSEISTVCDRIGSKYLREWFPCDDTNIRKQSLAQPDSTWRKRAYLAFINAMYKKECKEMFHRELEKMVVNSKPGSTYEIYIISSMAGGTGCGAFIPIALYAKKYIKRILNKDPIVSAVVACPDVFDDGENQDYIHRYANAYATLKEINALNLVSRGYNNPSRRKGLFTPIELKIGHEDEPVLGLLFDSSDSRYWVPDAAPFDKIYVLDKIPGVHTVDEHNTVIANSLYSLICTSIGASMDSEMSTHLLTTAQSNGGNAIFASVSTAQVRFPIETVLDYIASEKTLASCNEEWLRLYQLTEKEIDEDKKKIGDFSSKDRIAKEKEKKYANFLMAVVERELNSSNNGLKSILERNTSSSGSGAYPGQNVISKYLDRVCETIMDSVSTDKIIAEINKKVEDADFNSKDEAFSKKDFQNYAKRVFILHDKLLTSLRGHYSQYAKQQLIRNRANKIADAMLPINKLQDPMGNKEFSIFYNILTFEHNGIRQNCHPVAAIVKLSGLRQCIDNYLKDETNFDKDYRIGFLSDKEEKDRSLIPKELFASNDYGVNLIKQAKSRYCMIDKDESGIDEISVRQKNDGKRFYRFKTEAIREKYIEKRSVYSTDVQLMQNDAVYTARSINEYIQKQLLFGTLKSVLDRLDTLIDKYREFFRRFVDENAHAYMLNRDLLNKDTERAGSIINIYSSPEDKKRIESIVFGAEGIGKYDDIIRGDGISGEVVLDIVLNEFQIEFDEGATTVSDGSNIKELFNRMNEENKKIIEANPEFRKLRTSNLLRIIETACENKNKDLKKELTKLFTQVIDIATPTIQIEESPNENKNEILPIDVLRVLMSRKTAKYISQKAEAYGIPTSDGITENAILDACAEEFVKRYIHPAARVSVVDEISDGIMYITGEKMDISPVRISKFNELSLIPDYYRSYRKVLGEAKRKKNDLLNPHIGFNLYKSGFLPCINPREEERCNERIAKALLYAFMSGEIISKRLNKYENEFYIKCKYIDGDPDFANAKPHPKSKMWVQMFYENEVITDKNVPWLMSFLRNQDGLVSEWSDKFDLDVEAQLKDLPGVVSSESAKALTSMLKKKPFIRMISDNLYSNVPLEKELGAKNNEQQEDHDKEEMDGQSITDSLLGFAFRLKIGEELSRDYNDAERLLRIAYETFFDIFNRCYPVKFFPEIFSESYTSVIDKMRKFFLYSSEIKGIDARTRNRIVTWLNKAEVFKPIDKYEMFDQNDEFVFVDWKLEKVKEEPREKNGDKSNKSSNSAEDSVTESEE